jgi:hypothetical protein
MISMAITRSFATKRNRNWPTSTRRASPGGKYVSPQACKNIWNCRRSIAVFQSWRRKSRRRLPATMTRQSRWSVSIDPFRIHARIAAQLMPRDPMANFLFVRKKGHCEYFASSMAVMLRSLRIPSRIVTGFRGGEFNDLTDSTSCAPAMPIPGLRHTFPVPAGSALIRLR